MLLTVLLLLLFARHSRAALLGLLGGGRSRWLGSELLLDLLLCATLATRRSGLGSGLEHAFE